MVSPVTTCTLTADVGGIRDLMKQKGISALPVVEVSNGDARIRGIVSYFDLAGVYDDNVNIQQVMTPNVAVVSADYSAEEAAKVMLDKQIHHLVVIDKGEIVGMVSSMDFVRLVAGKKVVLKS